MNNNSEKLIAALKNAFKEFDEQCLQRDLKWAFDRKDAVREFDAQLDADGEDYNATRHWDRRIQLAGGQGMYTLLTTNGEAGITEEITKRMSQKAEDRNYKICDKLLAYEIVDVEDVKVDYSNDGFTGTFRIKTDRGVVVVDIEVILAGGYNIQRLHQRTITKVRPVQE